MTPLPLVFSPQADLDLGDIWLYIAEKSPQSADKFIDQILNQCQLLAQMPEIGRQREELAPGLRSFPVGRYLIFCCIQVNYLEIVRILSGYRDIDSLF